MSGGKAEAKAKIGNAVVRIIGSVFGGDADGGPGGGSDRGGYVQDRYCNRKLVK